MTTDRTGDRGPAPTDLELMLHADGELEGERLAAVEAHLAQSDSARRKLRGLGLVAGLVRERALAAASPADGIADLVMAAIDAGDGLADVSTDLAEATSSAPSSKPAEVVALPRRRRRPANDNARGFFALAAFAVAAAAALLFWGRTSTPGGELHPIAGLGAPSALTVQQPLEPEGDTRHGVEVAAVDFGARTGLVFYVPTGIAASSTTTVVWLSDDSAGGDE